MKIILLLFVLTFCCCTKPEKTSAQSSFNEDSSFNIKKPIKGVFSYGLGKNFHRSASLKLDYIDGMTAAFNWQDMEPREGMFDFRAIDEHLQWAIANNKILNIALYAGNKSPQWIYEKKVPMIQWKRRWKEDQAIIKKTDQTIESAPVFWHPVYLEYWKKFVVELGKRYGKNKAIGYILITGATPKDYTTGTVIRYDDDWQAIVEAGYTYDKHFAAWVDLIDHYMKILPAKTMTLALGPLRPGSNDLRLSAELADYIVRKKYKNIQFLCVVLNDTWFNTSQGSIKLRGIFKRSRQQGHFFGYQMVYSAHRNDNFKKGEGRLINDFGKTIQIAIQDGASWIEIWHDDIILPKYKQEGRVNQKYEQQIKKAHLELIR